MSLKNEEVTIKTHWRPVTGKPSPLWRRLWARLLVNKKETPAEQASKEDAPISGTKKDDSHE